MVARTTFAELDPIRMSVEDAVDVFRDSVLPALREQPGFDGVYVLVSPSGQSLVLSFWADDEAANAGIAGSRSFYAKQVEKFATIFRSPPGRETYEVVLADAPVAGLT
jgi:heme-degrading monooxygenase HmoA